MAASAPAVQGVAVDGVAVMGVEVAERTVAEVIGDAQRLGEQLGDPLYNTGDLACVYFLYRRTAEEIVARCGASGQSVRDALQKALAEAAKQHRKGVSAARIRAAAETMKRMFNLMSSKAGATRSVMLGAMPSVGSLLAEGYPELARSDDSSGAIDGGFANRRSPIGDAQRQESAGRKKGKPPHKNKSPQAAVSEKRNGGGDQTLGQVRATGCSRSCSLAADMSVTTEFQERAKSRVRSAQLAMGYMDEADVLGYCAPPGIRPRRAGQSVAGAHGQHGASTDSVSETTYIPPPPAALPPPAGVALPPPAGVALPPPAALPPPTDDDDEENEKERGAGEVMANNIEQGVTVSC
jgi:hypothetical protein